MRIPWARAKEISKRYDQDQVFIICFDRKKSDIHVAWYTQKSKDKKMAEKAIEKLKRLFDEHWFDDGLD